MATPDSVEHPARHSEPACRKLVPGDEADLVALAIIDDIFAGTIREIVRILDGRHREDVPCRLNLFNSHLAQDRVADHTVVQQRPYCREVFVSADLRVNAVRLPKVNLLPAQSLPAAQRLADHVVQVAVWSP